MGGAWIKHGNYRNGSGVDSTGQWIPMVPWFKAYQVEPGLDLFTGNTVPAGLDFDFESYLLTDNPKHAAELYEEKLQDYLATHHPGHTLKSIAYRETAKDYDLFGSCADTARGYAAQRFDSHLFRSVFFRPAQYNH